MFRALADGSKQVSKKRFDHSFNKFWKPFRKNALEKRKTLFLERKTLLAKELAGLAPNVLGGAEAEPADDKQGEPEVQPGALERQGTVPPKKGSATVGTYATPEIIKLEIENAAKQEPMKDFEKKLKLLEREMAKQRAAEKEAEKRRLEERAAAAAARVAGYVFF